MTEAQDRAYLEVEAALTADRDADVEVTPDGFTVKGVLFAARSSEGDLLVQLPAARAADLVTRGVARDAAEPGATSTWVTVSDTQDWVEMASEAHQFVGEPPVGRDS